MIGYKKCTHWVSCIVLVVVLTSVHTDLQVTWERLKDVTRRKYRNPLFNSPELIGPLNHTTLTLMDIWQELQVRLPLKTIMLLWFAIFEPFKVQLNKVFS